MRRLNKVLIAQRLDLGLDDAGDFHPAGGRDDHRDHHRTGLDKGSQRQQQKHRRERQERIHHAHQNGADLAAVVARNNPHDRADSRGDHHHGKAHRHRDLPRVEQPRGQIAAQRVGAKDMAAGAGRRKPRAQVDVKFVVGQQIRPDKTGKGQTQHHEQADHGQLVT